MVDEQARRLEKWLAAYGGHDRDAMAANPRRVVQRNATCATTHRFSDHPPQWSPSGNRLMFERLDHKREKEAIFTQRLDGSGLKGLKATPRRRVLE